MSHKISLTGKDKRQINLEGCRRSSKLIDQGPDQQPNSKPTVLFGITKAAKKGIETFDLTNLAGHSSIENTDHDTRHHLGQLKDTF